MSHDLENPRIRNLFTQIFSVIIGATAVVLFAIAPLSAEPVLVLRSPAGTIAAGAEDISSAGTAINDTGSSLHFRLRATLARELAQLTMGGALGLPMDVEICGTTWASGIVREPLVTGSLTIPVPDQVIAKELEQYLNGAVACHP